MARTRTDQDRPGKSPRLHHPPDAPGCSADDYASESRCVEAASRPQEAAKQRPTMATHDNRVSSMVLRKRCANATGLYQSYFRWSGR
jgi:hypothetical protein